MNVHEMKYDANADERTKCEKMELGNEEMENIKKTENLEH